jgi:ketosteroid isomerase-like protein
MTATDEQGEALAEALIRQRVEDWAKASRAKDIDGVWSCSSTTRSCRKS